MYMGSDPQVTLKMVELRQAEIRAQIRRGILARRRFRRFRRHDV